MNKQREALELALEAIKNPLSFNAIRHKAICEEIREALAESEPEPVAHHSEDDLDMVMNAEQEPVAWMMVNEEHGHKPTLHWKPQEDWHITWKAVPLYAAPPARKPLTDEQISAIVQSMSAYTWDAHMLARAIERAHGIGND